MLPAAPRGVVLGVQEAALRARLGSVWAGRQGAAGMCVPTGKGLQGSEVMNAPREGSDL